MHIAPKSNRRVPKLDIWKPGEAIIDFDVGQLKTAETRVRLEVANTASSKGLQSPARDSRTPGKGRGASREVEVQSNGKSCIHCKGDDVTAVASFWASVPYVCCFSYQTPQSPLLYQRRFCQCVPIVLSILSHCPLSGFLTTASKAVARPLPPVWRRLQSASSSGSARHSKPLSRQ